jgi:putative membrane protein
VTRAPLARAPLALAPLVLASAAVLAQIVYPLAPSDPLTVAIVLLFAAANVTHAWVAQGGRYAAGLVALAAGGGFAVEAIGVATGFPFGRYAYADSLGPRLLGVPLVVPLAWVMMAYPAYVAAARLAARPLPRAVVAGWAMAAWDLFLDPQMVAAGHWRWTDVGATVPGIPDVPAGNFLAWFAVGVAMAAGLDRLPRPRPRPRPRWPGVADDRLPIALYLWAYASSLLAHLAFFGRPTVALAGGLGMGVVAIGLLR